MGFRRKMLVDERLDRGSKFGHWRLWQRREGPHSARLFQKNQETKEVTEIAGKASDI